MAYGQKIYSSVLLRRSPARYGSALQAREFETDSGEEQAEIQKIAQRSGLPDTPMHKSMPRRK